MSRETSFLAVDALTFYQIERRLSDGFYNNAGTYEAFNVAHWANYARALTQTVLSAGHIAEYSRDFAGAAGIYKVAVFQQAGGSPSITADGVPITNVGAVPRVIYWDGTKEVPPAVKFDTSYNVLASAQVAVAVSGTAASSVAVPLGTDLTLYADKYSQLTFLITGLDSTGWTQFYFAIKRDTEASDGEALLLVKLTNPGSGSDGLVTLNGAAAGTASDGAIVASSVTPNTNLQLTLKNAAMVIPPTGSGSNYIYEIGRFIGAGHCEVLGTGNLTVQRPVIRQITAL